MNATAHTTQSVAREAFDFFTRKTRNNGQSFVTLSEGRPEWLYGAVYEAHGDMLPDDWKWQVCRLAVGAIADSDDDIEEGSDLAYEFADSMADTYNNERLAWLASSMERVYYVEDAAKEYGTTNREGEFDLIQLIGQGQYAEALEIFAVMLRAIEAERDARNGEAES